MANKVILKGGTLEGASSPTQTEDSSPSVFFFLIPYSLFSLFYIIVVREKRLGTLIKGIIYYNDLKYGQATFSAMDA